MAEITEEPTLSLPRNPWPSEIWLLLLAVGISLYLAIHRVYQVDEAQTVFMARILGKGLGKRFFVSGQLHLYPLALLARLPGDSATIFQIVRLAFLGLAWLNAVLLVWAAGLRLGSRAGLRALLLACSLAPWWAYALEARHDNILLLGLLVMWIVARRWNADRRVAFAVLGVVSLLLHASLFKALAYWIPLSMGLLVMEKGQWKDRLQRASAWGVGAILAWGAVQLLRWSTHTLPATGDMTAGLAMVGASGRFAPFHSIGMLMATSPLLAAGMVVVCVFAADLLRREGVRLSWDRDRGQPEAVFFLLGALVFLINPNPFPYNLLVLSFLGLLALVRIGSHNHGLIARETLLPRAWGAYGVAIFTVFHLLPVGIRVFGLLTQRNDRQVELMRQTESLTGEGDPVFDNSGLVATRIPSGRDWFINITSLSSRDRLFGSLKVNPPAVVIPNYRLVYLGNEVKKWLQANYVALSKDLWVLGRQIQSVSDCRGSWMVLREGIYAAVSITPSSDSWVEVDGRRLSNGVHTFTRGEHAFLTDPVAPSILLWAGPRATSPPALSGGGTDMVFPVPGDF